VAENLAIFEALIDSRAPAAVADTVALNAGAALWVAGQAESLAAGIGEAQRLLQTGAVKRHVELTRRFWAG
jgi:anthranilate phosphoribosyltransferase